MLKAKDDGLSKSWEVVKRQGAAYTGGAVSIVNATHAACLCSDRVALLSLKTGLVEAIIPGNGSVRNSTPWWPILRGKWQWHTRRASCCPPEFTC